MVAQFIVMLFSSVGQKQNVADLLLTCSDDIYSENSDLENIFQDVGSKYPHGAVTDNYTFTSNIRFIRTGAVPEHQSTPRTS